MSSRAVARMAIGRLHDRRLVLAYHGIIPDGMSPAGERALFVTQREFAMQLDALLVDAEVVPLDRVDEQGDGRPRVAITFDDAYAGAVSEGVSELVKRRLPATFFISPGRLNGHVFWWDALSHRGNELMPGVRRHALQELAGDDERVRAWAVNAALPISDRLPAHARAATVAQLSAAVANPGITVASHTWSHRNLARLGADEIAAEVRESAEWLRAQFGAKALDWLAYPYGLDSPEVHRALADASYAGALRIDGGWHRPAAVPRFERPRLNVASGLSVTGLRARLSGAWLS
jgi:peptidoglycan/xylan/chitin deacetylase (PgdA/CDA1 family)